MNIKNLYIAYIFQPDLYKWLNKREMIFKYNHDETPITIEFLNKSGKYYIERTYYKNGNIWWEIPYKNGQRHGLKKYYYENGNIEYETPYKNGLIHGLKKSYYENGNIYYETPYKNGQRHGLKKWYYENGKIDFETPYKTKKL